MTAYYNENDPYAAQWLRNLIDAGHIAPGNVDERSIVDVRGSDLAGYIQCHFFAGIGGWGYALRLAGWPDDRPVWTGSCPCQPFSSAGAGKAADDGRHLWPAWFPLIAECRPAVVFGEQVEAAIGWGWLDAVFADLEGEGYACGTAVLPACGVGAPHIRQRCWFVAHADGGDASTEGLQRGGEYGQRAQDGRPGGLAQPLCAASEWRARSLPRAQAASRSKGGRFREQRDAPWSGRGGHADGSERDGELGNAKRRGCQGRGIASAAPQTSFAPETSGVVNPESEQAGLPGRPRQSGSAHWQAAEWIECTDGKSRPIEPGSFPLAHGVPGRVGRLRAYGNAIVPQVAAEFIAAASETISQLKPRRTGGTMTRWSNAAIDAATRVFCSGLPVASHPKAETLAGLIAKGHCWAPDCPCWEQGRTVTRAALAAAIAADEQRGQP